MLNANTLRPSTDCNAGQFKTSRVKSPTTASKSCVVVLVLVVVLTVDVVAPGMVVWVKEVVVREVVVHGPSQFLEARKV